MGNMSPRNTVELIEYLIKNFFTYLFSFFFLIFTISVVIDLIFTFNWPFKEGTITDFLWDNRLYLFLLFLYLMSIVEFGVDEIEYEFHMFSFFSLVLFVLSIAVTIVIDLIFYSSWPFKADSYTDKWWELIWEYKWYVFIGFFTIALIETIAIRIRNRRKQYYSLENENNSDQEQYSQTFSNINDEEIIRQVLIKHSIGNLSDNIFVNIDGYLKNRSGSCLNEEYERSFRQWIGIDNALIYAFSYYDVQAYNGERNYTFTACILEEGIIFYAYDDSNSKEGCLLKENWGGVKNVTYTERANPNEDNNPRAHTIPNDPISMVYGIFFSQIFHYENGTYLYVPSLYFGNQELTNFLNDLFTSCKNSSFSKRRGLGYNKFSQNKKHQDIGVLSMNDQYFLDYLRDNPNTTIDESTVSIYNISIERANQLKEHFFK